MQQNDKRAKRRKKRRVGRVKQQRVTIRESTASDAVARVIEATIEPAETAVLGTSQDDHSMNTIELNEAALNAEAQAIAASVPQPEPVVGDPNQQPSSETLAVQPTPEEILEGNRIAFTALISGSANTFAPNWAVTAKETDELSDALARACVLWFPDGMIPPKYIALLAVVGIAGKIVMERRDPQTGKLKPLKIEDAKATSAAPAPSEAA